MARRPVRLYIRRHACPLPQDAWLRQRLRRARRRRGTLGLTGRAAALADRRTGIGCDQLIIIEPREGSGADAFMRILNPDGSEAGACGNATRCVAACWLPRPAVPRQAIRTISGHLLATCRPDGLVEVDMGPAGLDWTDIPLARPMDTLRLDLALGRSPIPPPPAWAIRTRHSSSPTSTPAGRRTRPGAGTPLAFPAARQYRLCPGPRAGPHPAEGLGARGRPDAGLRFRSLRGVGECAPPRPDRRRPR